MIVDNFFKLFVVKQPIEISEALCELIHDQFLLKQDELEIVLKQIFSKKIFMKNLINFGIHELLDEKVQFPTSLLLRCFKTNQKLGIQINDFY